jgi:hypothetical protein
MRRKRILLVLLGILFMSGLLMSGCDLLDINSNPFNGTYWENTESGVRIVLSFTVNSWTLSYPGDSETGSYTYSGNVAILRNDQVSATATISGGNLTVKAPDADTIVFTRTDSASSNVQNMFSGTSWKSEEDGEVVILSFYSSTWTIYHLDYDDDLSGTYTFSNNIAALIDGDETIIVTIQGDILIYSAQGKEIVFTRYDSDSGNDDDGDNDGGNDDDYDDDDSINLFVGKWEGSYSGVSITLTITESTWIAASTPPVYSNNGTYERYDYVAFFSDKNDEVAMGTVLGDTMEFDDYDLGTIIFTRQQGQ